MASSTQSNHGFGGGGEEEDEAYSFATQLLMGNVLPMALQTAFQLGVFEIIARAGPDAKLSAAEIVAKMATNNQDAPNMVDRIMRLLASYSVLGCSVVGSVRLYSLLPVSHYFVPNQDGVSLGSAMPLMLHKALIETWSQVKDAVLEGGIAFDRVHGMNAFEYAGSNPEFNQAFNTAMFNVSNLTMAKIVERYKGFEGIKKIVDVGGNQGITLRHIVSKYPNIKAINFDLPHVIEHAPSYHGIEHVAGDMFESVPEGDAIFMKLILHDWGDEHCLKLLKNCYKAIPENGKVIVVEPTVPDTFDTTPAAKASFLGDVVMLTQIPGGKERTKPEFVALATQAGFTRVKFDCFVSNSWIMEFYKS